MTIVNLLKNNVVNVEFVKTDGSIRNMKATLLDKYIKVKTASKNIHTSGLITVWDIEKKAWRSFKEESVLSVYILNQE